MYTCKDNLTPLLYSGEKKKNVVLLDVFKFKIIGLTKGAKPKPHNMI